MTANLDLIMAIPIDVQIVLGTSRMQVSGLMNLSEGATISLDRRIGEPVEIMVNGRIIGRGEITVLDGDDTRFGVKLIEIKGSKKS
ncbi:Flagellar motor switch protein FliN [compost metagenome]